MTARTPLRQGSAMRNEFPDVSAALLAHARQHPEQQYGPGVWHPDAYSDAKFCSPETGEVQR